MRLLISLILFLFFSSPVWATTWYVRNDGGTNAQCSGVTDAPYTSGTAYYFTNLVVDGSNNLKVTSASHNFTAGEVGNDFVIVSGTGWTTGKYSISSVSSNAAILNSSPAAVGTTGGTFQEGPACGFIHPAWLNVTNYNTTALFQGGDTEIIDDVDHHGYSFTVSGVSSIPVVGDEYTNNGITYTVTVSLPTGKTSGSMILQGSGAPTSSGSLTVVGGHGSGTSPISFSSYAAAQAQYVIGYTMPNNAGPNCSPSGGDYACILNAFPGGPDSSHPSKILGKNWNTGCNTKPQIWGQGAAAVLIGLNGSNFDVECLEVTQHSACMYNGSVNTPVDGFPTQCTYSQTGTTDGNWAKRGVTTSGSVNDNLTFKNLYIHGMAVYPLEIGGDSTAGTFGNITLNDDLIVGNGAGGFQTNAEMYSDLSGPVLIENTTIAWSGCTERYPLQNAANPIDAANITTHSCASQSQNASAADSIAFSNDGAGEPGTWIILNDNILWGTQDGIDMLHGNGDGTTTIAHSLIEGNMGQQIKVVGDLNYIENNIINADCAFFEGQPFTATTSSATTSGECFGTWDPANSWCDVSVDTCRANGTAILVRLKTGNKYYYFNNTVNSGGSNITYELDGTGNSCDGTTLVQANNNVYLGGYNWGDDTYHNSGGGNGLTTFIYNDGGSTGGTCDNVGLTEDYDIADANFKNSVAGCGGAHSQCGVDPKVVGPVLNGHGSLSSYYHGPQYSAADYLTSASPARGAGSSSLTYQQGSIDYNGDSRPPWDLGALIYGSCIVGGNSCTYNSDCCSNMCTANVCSGSSGATATGQWNGKLIGVLN